MPTYVLRYRFEPGSGVCLWAANDQARQRYGFAVALEGLKLPRSVIDDGNRLIARFDMSINWDDPPDPSPWTKPERFEFHREAGVFLTTLRHRLGEDFEIRDDTAGIL